MRGGATTRALTAGETAWVALIPCAVVMLAAIVVLGPPLGRALFRPGGDVLWPPGWWEARGHPEPLKHGRYLLAAAAPLVLATAIVVLGQLQPRLRPGAIRGLVLTAQASTLAFVVVGVLGQRNVIPNPVRHPELFSVADYAIAAALVAAAAIACRRQRIVAWVAQHARERRLTRVAGLAIAAAFAALWVFEVVQSDGLTEDFGKMSWIPNGTFAVLDGRTPLVDLHVIYAKLLPYPTALVMSAFGATALTFTAFMGLLTLAALLAVYAMYRRIVGSAFALALFLPFVAMSDAFQVMQQASIWPMRYGDAYLLAWLTARHLDRSRPRGTWPLFLVGGLVTIDMLDFGLAALLATVAALLFARPPRSARDAWRLARAIALGLAAAVGAVTAFTLVRAGAPPSLGILLEWSRVFTGLGWFSLPMPRTSLAFAIYATYAAAIAVAGVRVVRRENGTLLTGMLAWSGVFGLVAGNYYVVRADDLKLFAMCSGWAFSLGLLTIVCVRALTARGWRSPTLAELLVLFGFALAVCTVVGVPWPARTIRNLENASPPMYRPAAEALVSAYAHRGEKVAILLPEGYRIAYELGLDNVSPYEMENAIVTRRQMQTLLRVIQRERITALFTPSPGRLSVGDGDAAPQQLQAFRRAGFQEVAVELSMIAWRRP